MMSAATASSVMHAARKRQRALLAAQEELSAAIAAEKRRVIQARKDAMQPLRAALAARRDIAGPKHRWLAEQIAAATGGTHVSQQVVSNYLNGHSRPSYEVLRAMCQCAEVPVSRVLRRGVARSLIIQQRPHPTVYRPRK